MAGEGITEKAAREGRVLIEGDEQTKIWGSIHINCSWLFRTCNELLRGQGQNLILKAGQGW